MIKRRKTKKVKLGKIFVGGSAPVSVQSMCNTKTPNAKATIKQIKKLEDAGCEIIRVAVPDMKAVRALKVIKKEVSIPLVADIHFNYKLAIASMPFVDKIRIDPGNIGSIERFRKVIESAKDHSLPMRIGVNSGSVERDLLKKFGGPTPEAMVKSALKHIKFCEKNDFADIIISLKSTNVLNTIKSNELLSKKTTYPLHLGVTQAGASWIGTIKSSVGLGCLLKQGIGDTVRVSLTGDPVEEVKVGWEILKSLNLRHRGKNIISCPTCGRTEIDLPKLVSKVEKALPDVKEPITIAIMGCVVNGPGEAKQADVGIAGGQKCGVIFRKGKIVKRVKESELLSELLKEIRKVLKEKKG